MTKYYEGEVRMGNVIFNGMELLDKYSRGKLRKCTIYDEAIRDLYKREAMTVINTVLVKLLDLGGWEDNFLIAVLPNFWRLDGDVRNMIDARLYAYTVGLERGFTKFYKAEPYLDYRFTYRFNPFPKKIYDVYKKKKLKAFRQSVKDFREILKRRMGQNKRKRKKILEELYMNPEASTSAIARKIGTSESYMGRIKRERGLT